MSRNFVTRFGTLLMAFVFLITSVGFTALLLWQSSQDDAPEDNIEVVEQDELNNQPEGDMLQGTQLENFTPLATPVGELQITDTAVGDGEEVKAGATVTAHYTGAVASTGTIFQSSHDFGEAVPFSLNGVIAGWTEGVPGMKVGGTRRLVIPAAKAYGATPPEGSGIPANADLVFDIQLVAVEQ